MIAQSCAIMPALIFASDFKPRPYWWEHHEPAPLAEIALPPAVRVVIVGEGLLCVIF